MHSSSFNSAPASPAKLTKLLPMVVIAVIMTSVPACSKFHKSATVNQPTPLARLPASHHVLTQVFNQQGLGSQSAKSNRHFSLGNANIFSRKQKVALQQSPNQFQVASDANGYVTANANGVITATNLNGKRVWQASLKQGLASGVAIDTAGSTVVVSDAFGGLIAFDRQTGKQRWQSHLNSSVLSPALITNDRVISLTNSGVISANSLQTGELIWQFATQNPALSVRGGSSPILLNATSALVATADGRVHAINLDDGTPLWSTRMGIAQGGSDIERLADIDATPVLNNNMLYVTSYSGQLTAVDLTTRQLVFVKDKDYASIKKVGVDDSQIYVTTLDGKVAALDKQTGNVNWENNDLRFRGLSNALATNNVVLVGDALGYLHVLDKATGKLIDRAQLRSDIAQLQVSPQGIIATSQNGGFSVWQVNR